MGVENIRKRRQNKRLLGEDRILISLKSIGKVFVSKKIGKFKPEWRFPLLKKTEQTGHENPRAESSAFEFEGACKWGRFIPKNVAGKAKGINLQVFHMKWLRFFPCKGVPGLV